MSWVVRYANGTCGTIKPGCQAPAPTAPSAPAGSGAIVISASVGMGGTNRPTDVLKIQAALNKVPAGQGNPVPPITVDGQCGSKTNNAIQMFQLKHFGWPGADGRVDPGGQTLSKLNALAGGPMLFAGADSGADIRLMDSPEVHLAILLGIALPQVLHWVKLAQTEIQLAQAYVNSPVSPERSKRMERLNRHFQIDALSSKAVVLQQILKVFQAMEQAVLQGGVGIYRVYYGTMVKNADAFTWSGGFHYSPTAFDPYNKLFQRAIYIPASIVVQLSGTKLRSIGTLVHELAHFTGTNANVGPIDDQGDTYGGVASEKIVKLPPYGRIHCAECYANFAYELRTGDYIGWYITAG